MEKDSNKKNFPSQNMRRLSLGINMAVGMGVFTYIGYFIDQKSGKNFWTLVGIFLGLFFYGYEIWKLIKEK